MINEIRCGTCRHWFAWSSLYKRNVAKKALATGCDGRCCYDDGTEQEQRELNSRTRNSYDPLAVHCKFYEEQTK